MSNKKLNIIAKEINRHSIVFLGYPHRRHRTIKKKAHNNKKLLTDKIIDAEHQAMLQEPF